ncbi:MAG: histidine kinase dimerization/phospho-acceptor domain-containing protein [Planctomycetota bacterium]
MGTSPKPPPPGGARVWPWIVAATALCLIVGLAAVTLWALGARELQRQELELQDHAQWARTAIELRIEGHRRFLQSLADGVDSGALSPAALSEKVIRYVENAPEIVNVGCVDETLRLRYFAFGDATRRILHSRLHQEGAEQRARAALASRQPVYGAPFRTRWDDTLFELWVPFSRDGLLLTIISCEDLLGEGIPWSLRENYRFSWVDSRGEYIAGKVDPKRPRAAVAHTVLLPTAGLDCGLRLFREVRTPVTDPMILLLLFAGAIAVVMSLALIRLTKHSRDGLERRTRLEHEVDQLRSVIEQSPEGVIVADPEGRFLYFNAAAHELLGVGPAEVPLVEWSAHFGFHRPNQKELYPSAELPMARAIHGQRVREVELHVRNARHPDGLPIRASSSPVLNANNDLIAGVALLRDSTDEKVIKDELIEAWNQAVESSQAKSVFLSYMSHEIRSPMNAMLTEIESLTNLGSLGESHAQSTRTVRQNCVQLISMLDDVLALSMLESGITKVLPAPSIPRELLDEAVLRARDAASRLGVTIAIDYREGVPATIDTDPARLLQVLTNLLDLALQAAGAHQHVQLVIHALGSGAANDSYLSITFVGVDPGLSQEELAGIYESYARADAATMLQFGAAGLRLGICKRLAQMLGGDISLRRDEAQVSLVLRIATGGFIRGEAEEPSRHRPEDPRTQILEEPSHESEPNSAVTIAS